MTDRPTHDPSLPRVPAQAGTSFLPRTHANERERVGGCWAVKVSKACSRPFAWGSRLRTFGVAATDPRGRAPPSRFAEFPTTAQSARRQFRLEFRPAHPIGAILVKTFQSPRKLGVLGAEERQLSAAQAVPKLADQRQTFRRAKAGDLINGQNGHALILASLAVRFKFSLACIPAGLRWKECVPDPPCRRRAEALETVCVPLSGPTMCAHGIEASPGLSVLSEGLVGEAFPPVCYVAMRP